MSIQRFNSGQQQVFNKAINSGFPELSINNIKQHAAEPHIPSQLLFFLDAPGGTGKSFVTTAIRHFQNPKEKHVLEVGLLAVARPLLSGGRRAAFALKNSSLC